jgi:hypothetical protein
LRRRTRQRYLAAWAGRVGEAAAAEIALRAAEEGRRRLTDGFTQWSGRRTLGDEHRAARP